MNVVVEERTKEIGIKMALGAKRRYVIGQFLFETLLITIVGGIIGFLISWGICAAFPSSASRSSSAIREISFQVRADHDRDPGRDRPARRLLPGPHRRQSRARSKR